TGSGREPGRGYARGPGCGWWCVEPSGLKRLIVPLLRFWPVAVLLWASLASAPASGTELAPFKDRLFAYPAVLAAADDGAYAVFDYRKERDIDLRDDVPERRANRQYVDLAPRRVQQERKLETGAGKVRYFAV